MIEPAKFGKLTVNGDFYKDTRTMAVVLQGFIPLRVEFMAINGHFELVGYHEDFDELQSGEACPDYNAVIATETNKDTGELIGITRTWVRL